MKRLRNNESGQALILALMLLAVGSFLSIPALSLSSTSLGYHRVTEKNTLEVYAADSGVEYAVCQLGNNSAEYEENPLEHSFTMNDGTVAVTAEYIGGSIYKITSVADNGIGSGKSIESYVVITVSLFDYGMAATEGNINLSGNAEVTSSPDSFDGDIYANGAITLSGNAEVQGDATATGEISVGDNASVSGDQEENLENPLVFAQIDTSVYLEEANQGTLIEGDLVISGNGYYDLGPAHITGNLIITDNRIVRLNGTVYVDGSITMSGNTRLEGAEAVVAVGDIQITGNTQLTVAEIPLVISIDGDITVSGNSWTSALLYAQNGDITLSGNSKVCGAVVGQNITASGNNEVEYLTGLKGRGDLPGAGGVDVLSYTR
jgi:Tfp pilus assembly protein PilX